MQQAYLDAKKETQTAELKAKQCVSNLTAPRAWLGITRVCPPDAVFNPSDAVGKLLVHSTCNIAEPTLELSASQRRRCDDSICLWLVGTR